MDTVVDLNLFIANEWRPTAFGQTFDIDNPTTGEVMGWAGLGDRADAIAALEPASRAFPAWSKTTGDGRSRLLKKPAKSFMTKANTSEKSWTIL
jgi:succinate-semialdehyde dehydrogenase/glutarate-semialdehyde dehydrogenase